MRSWPLPAALALSLALGAGCDPGRDPGRGPARDPGGPPKAEDRAQAPEAPAVGASGAAPSSDEGRELVARFECHRCHEGTGLAPPPIERRCVGCHDEIARGTFAAPPDVLASFRPHVEPLRFAPPLGHLARLVRPAWIAEYLAAPFDLRPGLHPTMPRLALDTREAASISLHLEELAKRAGPGPEAPLGAGEGDADRGRLLFAQRGCSGCHAFGGAGIAPPPASAAPGALPDLAEARALAPDLRHARERLRAARVVAWIRDPRSVRADATMPRPVLGPGEAEDLAAFVLRAPLDPLRPRSSAPRLPVLERPVRWDEVSSRVLRKICWHCHALPDLARGDGGPGNSGGFGFAPRRIDLSRYEAVVAGAIDEDGEVRSLLEPGEGGAPPLLLRAILARQEEERGRPGPVRGMPLGLPSLSPEDVQLVESWIAQGWPR